MTCKHMANVATKMQRVDRVTERAQKATTMAERAAKQAKTAQRHKEKAIKASLQAKKASLQAKAAKQKAVNAKEAAAEAKDKATTHKESARKQQEKARKGLHESKAKLEKKRLAAKEAVAKAVGMKKSAEQYASGLGKLTTSLKESSRKWYARENTMECGLSCTGEGRACCLDWQEEPIFARLKKDINEMAVGYMGCFYNQAKTGASWKLSQVSDLVRGASKNKALATCSLDVEHQPPLDCRYEASAAATQLGDVSLVHQEKRPACKLPVDRSQFTQLCDKFKTSQQCKVRQDKICSFQQRLKKHKSDIQNAKRRARQAQNKKLLCRPSGSGRQTTGAAAVVDLFFDTAEGVCKPSKYSSKWNDFWKKPKRSEKPEGCVFTVALTLTQKSDKSVQTPLVQSYAAVANAESYEQRKCREGDKRHCTKKHNGCGKFLWMADMIARDALTSTRFALAEQLLT